MRAHPALWVLCEAMALFLSQLCHAWTEIRDLGATYEFLVSDRSTRGGALHAPDGNSRPHFALPLSFYDSEQYWGTYVCALPNANCAVTDYYDPSDYSVGPRTGEAGDLQTERVNVHNGTNIYDAATWQIAVMLGSVVNRYGHLVREDAYDLVSYENRLLSGNHDEGTAAQVSAGKRATTAGKLFLYNGHAVGDPREAYSFRMISSTWLSSDPFAGSRYASLIVSRDLPANKPEYQPGKITWSDWKPLTGENAWAYLLGPLHAAYLHYVVGRKWQFVPFKDLAVQNALGILPTFSVMQSPLGAVYYAPSGTFQNDSAEPVNPHFVSVENNFSLYAGINVLSATLQAELTSEKTLSRVDRQRIHSALRLIDTMISGGELPDGRSTQGLLSFFKIAAWHEGEFVQGGFANDPARGVPWIPLLQPKAVDVNTWGVAALGAGRIDAWFGFGAAYRLWNQLKSWGAYGVDRTLWGVGYSDADGNGRNPDGTYRQGVLSAEWTAGAIVMIRNMIGHYRSIAPTSRNFASAHQYEQDLRADENAMIDGVQTLRYDWYVQTSFPGKPEGYSSLIVQPTKPYLYASKRYRIPFGWYANPIPSTCATAWIVMVADDYDPFGYGGKLN